MFCMCGMERLNRGLHCAVTGYSPAGMQDPGSPSLFGSSRLQQNCLPSRYTVPVVDFSVKVSRSTVISKFLVKLNYLFPLRGKRSPSTVSTSAGLAYGVNSP